MQYTKKLVRIGLVSALILVGAAPTVAQEPDPATRTERTYPATRSESDLDSLLTESRTRSRRSRSRVSRTPEFFGDNFVGGFILADTGVEVLRAGLPLGSGSRRAKIADHNKAYPTDRVFFNYHLFGAALNVDRPASTDEQAVDRYTLGFERTFGDGQWSAELRMPLAGRYSYESADFRLRGGNFGNLAVILKRLVYEDCNRAVSVGLGIDTPTGTEAEGRLPVRNIDFTVFNQSVHLLPYIGFVAAPSDLFFHGSIQLDVPLNGNEVLVNDAGTIERGFLTEQSLLYLDFSTGYWLYRDCCCSSGLTGLAAVFELHHTTTLQDGDAATFAAGATTFDAPGDFGALNTTVGLHAELASGTKLRVGGAFPLGDDFNRFFDSELMVSLIRDF